MLNQAPNQRAVVHPGLPMTVEAIMANRAQYEERYEHLTGEVMRIQASFSDRDRLDANGVRLDDFAFHNWRKRANFAMQAMIREKRQIRLLLHQARLAEPAVHSQPVVGDDIPALARSLRATAQRLAEQLQRWCALVETDADFDDLAECLTENLGELQEVLGRAVV